MNQGSTIAMILASGEGSRFDGIKQLAKIGDEPMLLKVCRQVQEVCEVFVVLGAYASEIEPLLDQAGVNSVINPNWKTGMSSGIALGVAHVKSAYPSKEQILITLGDQPFIPSRSYDTLINKAADFPDRIVAAGYHGTIGVPAIFPRRLWSELQSLQGDKGARKLLRNTPGVIVVQVPTAGRDIDTAADLS